MNHFDEMTCMLYLDGQLDAARARELAEHADACAECRALLGALTRESLRLREALTEEDEAVPGRLLAPPARESMPWAWITSLGFAAAGAYTLWTGFIEPWRQQLSQAGFAEGNLLAILFFGGAFWKGWGEMQNVLQFLAVTTLGILALLLLRRNLRRWTTIAVVMGSLVATFALAPAASAAEIKKEQMYELRTGETIKTDLIVAANTAHIDGTVEGDLIVFCRSLTINGRVAGDLIGFARDVRISGEVQGNVRTFSQSLSLNGSVGKNVMSFVETLDADRRSQVGGSMTLFAGDATLEGRVARDLLSYGGRNQLNGFLGGNALIRADHLLSIGSSADVRGKTVLHSHRQPEISPSAKLAFPPEIHIVKYRPDYATPRFYWRQALRWGAAFLFGLVVMLLMPSFFTETVRSVRRYGVSLGLGCATLVAIPFLAVVACITLVGLAVGIGSVLLWLMAIYATPIIVGTWFGESLLGDASGTGALLGRLALGLFVFRVLRNLPYVGGLVELLVILGGLGALSLAIYGRLRRQPLVAA